ncbi:acetyl esterase/lipase [Acinetobacter calcoaceticus]|uniref:Acetyl esterase/lipase n=1 Tax=Acinetobacter calcoaceticus TaxID=471 RepID=A0A4R1Y087_ACICA|nr:acetyl esterase/lipase [Acinetobacter calcoaceticus]
MFNLKLAQAEQWGRSKYDQFKQQAKRFRLYDLGSIALNGLSSKRSYRLTENIAYGLKARQRLDVYISNHNHFVERPLVVFVYGGAWAHGDKSSYRFVGEALTRFGYDVAVINYHHAPRHKFPSYIDDLALALNYLDKQQHRLGISTQRIALMGHSAGAFNILSLLYHPQSVQCIAKASIQAVIGLAGPYHFDYLGDALAQDAFEQSVPYQQVMPYYFVSNNQVRHYLFLAERDQIVKDQNSFDLHEKLLAEGNHSQIDVIPRTSHISIMASFASLFSGLFDTRSRIIQALDETFQAQRR